METEQKYLYVVFSRTPYRMGSFIRFFTGESYNHVSLAMEADLNELYAFARRYYHTPFYGGFVTEEPCRYHHKGKTAAICLCRLPVSDAQAQQLRQKFSHMNAHSQHYLYNHLSALIAPLHWRIPVKDAYTCAEFAVSVLQEMGYDFDRHRFYAIDDIAKMLEPYRVYTGDFPGPPNESSTFFLDDPIPHPILACLRDMLALLARLDQ